MGGSINGSQIFGTYPSSLGDDSDVGVGRGTLVPGTSWEALWNGVGEWLGVPPDQMSTVLPNRDNFAANQLITQSELFVEPIPLTSSPTPSPSPPPPPPTPPRCGNGVGDWNLVFRQTAGTYLSPVSCPLWPRPTHAARPPPFIGASRTYVLTERRGGILLHQVSGWASHNSNDPNSDNFSILDTLEAFRLDTGKFELSLVWPDTPSASGAQIWRQSTNPVTATIGLVEGYEPVDLTYTGNGWRGLDKNGNQALLDGAAGGWWYAVGSGQVSPFSVFCIM